MSPDPTRVASAFAKKAAMSRVAGEVRFIKDRSGDKSEWGWGQPGPSERHIQEDFVFNARETQTAGQDLTISLDGPRPCYVSVQPAGEGQVAQRLP